MFTETFLPHANGVTTSLLNAREGLKRRGHNVTIYSAGPPLLDAADVHFYGGKIFHLYPDFPIAFYPNRKSAKNKRRLNEEGADLVHVHAPGPMGWRGYKASKRLKIPLVLTHHTVLEPLVRYAPMGWKSLYRAGTHFISKRLVRAATTLIAPSKAARQELIDKYPEAESKIRIVPTGIDVDRFRPDLDGSRIREDWGYTRGERVVLYLGRLSYEKRVDLLLDAFAKIHRQDKDTRFVIGGTGPAWDDLQHRARKLGLERSVRFEGHVADHLLPNTYAAADAFASASEVETQGLTLLEAMAVGRPVAVAAVGGYLDYIHEGHNGFLFPRGDKERAVEAIQRALDAPPGVRREARRTAERTSTRSLIPVLESVYKETLRP